MTALLTILILTALLLALDLFALRAGVDSRDRIGQRESHPIS